MDERESKRGHSVSLLVARTGRGSQLCLLCLMDSATLLGLMRLIAEIESANLGAIVAKTSRSDWFFRKIKE